MPVCLLAHAPQPGAGMLARPSGIISAFLLKLSGGTQGTRGIAWRASLSITGATARAWSHTARPPALQRRPAGAPDTVSAGHGDWRMMGRVWRTGHSGVCNLLWGHQKVGAGRQLSARAVEPVPRTREWLPRSLPRSRGSPSPGAALCPSLPGPALCPPQEEPLQPQEAFANASLPD